MNINWLRLYTKITAAYRLSQIHHKTTFLGGASGEIPESLNVKCSIEVHRSPTPPPPPQLKKKPEILFKILDARMVTRKKFHT